MNSIPIYSICNLHHDGGHDIVVTDLASYLQSHQSLVFPHRHSFYQVLYITKEGGRHLIDFRSYPVKRGMIFFLPPGQIHEWQFDKHTDGILINFGEPFFSTFLAGSGYLNDLPLFSRSGRHCAADFSKQPAAMDHLFQQIFSEYQNREENCFDMLRALLLQVFLLAGRALQNKEERKAPWQYRQLLAFEHLVEQYYTQKKLPKEYAELMFITPNYLNALCTKLTGRSAGDLIRNRVLLEIKRLLVHSSLSVQEIAWQLNFENNSYFSRFFKKYEKITPEEFKKKFNQG